jgi:hypothetical protein
MELESNNQVTLDIKLWVNRLSPLAKVSFALPDYNFFFFLDYPCKIFFFIYPNFTDVAGKKVKFFADLAVDFLSATSAKWGK